MKKEFGVRELCSLVNVSEGTMRAWIMKPIIGEVYDSSKVNYDELKKGLLKYFDSSEIKEMIGCDVEEIVIVKKPKTSYNNLEVNELEVGNEYDIHNYSLVNTYKLIEVTESKIYIFENERGLKAYKEKALQVANIKIRLTVK